MTESPAHVRVIEETPAYWRIVCDDPPFNIVDASIFEALQDLLARMDASPSLRVAVFESAIPEFYLAHFRIDLQWQSCAVQFMRDPFDASDLRATGGHGRHSVRYRYRLALFVRQNIEKPSDTSGNGADRTKNAEGDAGDQPGKDECKAESQDNRPRRRCGKLDRAWRLCCRA